jgi:hypothetical protein
MRSFSALIEARRSTRRFTDKLLTPEQVTLILKAGLMSPLSKRSTPRQFVAVEDMFSRENKPFDESRLQWEKVYAGTFSLPASTDKKTTN